MWHRRKHKQREAVENAKEARLTKAEGDLLALKVRANRAIGTLDTRSERNHFAEAIRATIQRG